MTDGEKYSFVKADDKLFAIYQTIYSNADLEMWYSWDLRLGDTIGRTDEKWFLYDASAIVGGAIIGDGYVLYAFMVPVLKIPCYSGSWY